MAQRCTIRALETRLDETQIMHCHQQRRAASLTENGGQVGSLMVWEHHWTGRRRAHRAGRSAGSALALYASQLGQLVERHAAEAALLVAKEKAEREAAEAKRARTETERVLVNLRVEMESRQQAQSRLAFLACHDPLTALPNRTIFSERLGREMDDARRYGRRLAALH
jgi:hypothetical protein